MRRLDLIACRHALKYELKTLATVERTLSIDPALRESLAHRRNLIQHDLRSVAEQLAAIDESSS
jgi:hypothetical protein